MEGRREHQHKEQNRANECLFTRAVTGELKDRRSNKRELSSITVMLNKSTAYSRCSQVDLRLNWPPAPAFGLSEDVVLAVVGTDMKMSSHSLKTKYYLAEKRRLDKGINRVGTNQCH